MGSSETESPSSSGDSRLTLLRTTSYEASIVWLNVPPFHSTVTVKPSISVCGIITSQNSVAASAVAPTFTGGLHTRLTSSLPSPHSSIHGV